MRIVLCLLCCVFTLFSKRFSLNYDIILDRYTNLIWQTSGDLELKNYEDAKNYCQNLSLAGFSDWRLPIIDELMSIVDKSTEAPAINQLFKSKDSFYWSSSRYEKLKNENNYWGVHFRLGLAANMRGDEKGYTRCVRRHTS